MGIGTISAKLVLNDFLCIYWGVQFTDRGDGGGDPCSKIIGEGCTIWE